MSSWGRGGGYRRTPAGRAILAVALVLGLTPLASAAGPASAADEVTRENYRAAVEPICKTNAQANERIFKGVRGKVRRNELKPAAIQFEKAATALKRTLAQLRAVPQPAADKAKLGKWLADVKVEVTLFEAVAAKLRAGNKTAAEEKVVRLTHNADLANNVVIGFEFTHCRFEPSRFT